MTSNSPPPPWQPRKEVSFWLATAVRLLNRAQDHELKALGFTASQVPVLVALTAAEPRSQKELAELARIEQPSMTELLLRMERDGLVRRAPNPQDGRSVMVSLTDRARADWPRAAEGLTAAEARLISGLDAAEKATLIALLQQLVWNSGQGSRD